MLNQTLEQYLLSYGNYLQDDYIVWLPILEFGYNNSAYSFIGESLFYLAYSQHSSVLNSIHLSSNVNVPSTKACATQFINFQGQIKKRLDESRK